MVTIPIWVLAAVLALAGAKVIQTPVGTGLKMMTRKTYRLIVPKKPARIGDRVSLKCTLAEGDKYDCVLNDKSLFIISRNLAPQPRAVHQPPQPLTGIVCSREIEITDPEQRKLYGDTAIEIIPCPNTAP